MAAQAGGGDALDAVAVGACRVLRAKRIADCAAMTPHDVLEIALKAVVLSGADSLLDPFSATLQHLRPTGVQEFAGGS